MNDDNNSPVTTSNPEPHDAPSLGPALGYLGFAICSGIGAWHAFHMESAFGWGIAAMVCLLIAHLAKQDDAAEITPRLNEADVTASVSADDSRLEMEIACENVPDVVQSDPPIPMGEPGRFVRWFAKFLQGDFGLAKTFWLFGALGSVVWGLLMYTLVAATQSQMVTIACAYFSFFFLLFVSGATWDAATKYKGDPVWAILAKLNVVSTVLGYFINVYLLL
jgi:hypothetical protein